jgi:hypothetical protein
MTETSEVAGRADADLAALAAEAFIYGFPLVADLEASRASPARACRRSAGCGEAMGWS